MKFKILGVGLVLAVLIWFGWWWMTATAQQNALENWLADRRAEGWQAEAAEISIAGFPNRLDTTLTRPALADPSSGWAWNSPFLVLHQVIYDPTSFIVLWPNTQMIAAPGASGVLTSDVMQASISLGASHRLDVQRASFELRGAAFEGVEGWRVGATSWIHHIRRAPDAGPDNAYEFRADGVGVVPPKAWRDLIDPTSALPNAMENIVMEGRIAFDRPLDRFALEGAKPQITALTLKEAQADWGGLSLAITGAIRADDQGFAEGELTINARKWRDMVDAAVASSVLSQRAGDAVKSGLGLLARLSGRKDEITAPLAFSGGLMRIGPIPIGRAPRLMN